MFRRDFIRLRFLSRLVGIWLILPGQPLAAEGTQSYRVFLQNSDQTVSLDIARIEMKQQGDGFDYRVYMDEKRFADYFLNMRPFKCMTDKVNMLCHLAYPYSIERRITNTDFSALEHDFLFIRRKPTDYGIDPWNGLYYRIHKKGNEYLGQAHEVDLNILAVPPDNPLPLKDAELHEIDEGQLWLPRLLIRRD